MKKAERPRRAVPDADPAFAVLDGILDVVRTTSWLFARVEANGALRMLAPGSNESARAALGAELHRQRGVAPHGPRIAATSHVLAQNGAGITLIFADARNDYGIMMLIRDAAIGPFTSSEIAMLTFALDAGCDRLAALRLQPPLDARPLRAAEADASFESADHQEAFYVLDSAFRIVLAWSYEQQRRNDLTGSADPMTERLPEIVEEAVRQLTVAWATSGVKAPGIARPVPFLVVRTQPMAGPAGEFIGVRVDRVLPPNSLTTAAAQFHISPREVQVLARLLDGDHLDQIAAQLFITSSTVQDHIKSMLDKTLSRNRSELIARVLGWNSATSLPAEQF